MPTTVRAQMMRFPVRIAIQQLVVTLLLVAVITANRIKESRDKVVPHSSLAPRLLPGHFQLHCFQNNNINTIINNIDTHSRPLRLPYIDVFHARSCEDSITQEMGGTVAWAEPIA